MELFTINRYTTQHDDKADTGEDVILDKLLRKIEKHKKKQKEAAAVAVAEPVKPAVDTEPAGVLEAEIETETVEQDTTTNETALNDEPTEEQQPTKSSFTVLGEDVQRKKVQKVEMRLAPWLAHPTIISTSIKSQTDEEEAESTLANITYLAPHIKQALKEMQINRLFPVQTAVIPWILEAHAKPTPFRPRDICVSAPTGSGKTLAFAAPIVQLLATRVERKIRALVVLPVTELALQVYKVFDRLCKKTDLSVLLLSKQLSLADEQHQLVEMYKNKYYSKVDILVTTPGRLVEHLHATKGFSLKSLKFLVIDEADRIMDAVFQNWLYHLDTNVRETSDQLLAGRVAPICYNELLQSATTQPHKLLFSATLSQDPEKLKTLRLFQPKLFTSVLPKLPAADDDVTQDGNAQAAYGEFIGKYTTPAELTEKYCLTETRLKPLTLYALVYENKWTKFLCFTNTIAGSNRLAFVLSCLFQDEGIRIEELSGSLTPAKRLEYLSLFSRGLINGLVCSDALARGIDIPDVDVVISYDAPRHVKTYIHRIGRTARAGRLGTAITLVNQKELSKLNELLAEAGKSLTGEITSSTAKEEEFAKKYTIALSKLRNKLEYEKKQVLIKKRHAETVSKLQKNPEQLSLVDKLKLQAIQIEEEREHSSTGKVPKRLRTKQQKHI